MALFCYSHVGFGVLRWTSVSVRELFCFYLFPSLFPANCIYMLRSKYHEQNGNVFEIGKFSVPFPSTSSNFTRTPEGLRVIPLCFAEFKLLLTRQHCYLRYFLLINVLISRATNESRILIIGTRFLTSINATVQSLRISETTYRNGRDLRFVHGRIPTNSNYDPKFEAAAVSPT